jgi:hypothetical protein
MKRGVWRTAFLLPLILPALAFAAEDQFVVELNKAETADNRCRLTFVVENKTDAGLESLKLDLVVFNRENRVQLRTAAELGPVRAAKTMVKTFAVNGKCADIRSVLVNDVAACAPGDTDACLDGLALSSLVEGLRLFK